ncbi:putative ABC transporter ATP-binding protein [Candidatus Izimaplasma bacterium HR1]|jgi:ATPase subunit of ABC transporter with duplicated ATPase domains|uniref:ribosomal protection-like ABC-F family protein n=1 Tax=Candidatus Izimoplasma sp. HR1 TaxID=1541959 RepID=UPI0004F5F9A4|nr:putative ABC transporter ATP-binding protein [Candidatus Izimaplasma bacterium HR1]
MIEVNINNISKTFGADLIFENISFDIKTNERIGLIGPNGSGKTTLIKMLYGVENINSGSVSFRKGSKLGYLDQIPDYEDNVSVLEILEMSFEETYKIKKIMDELSHSFGDLSPNELDKALKEYSRLTEIYEHMDGYNTDTKINKVCAGLRINDVMRNSTFNTLSGGEKTRVTLAKILLEEPSVLMLDEPSNHLDLESIEWLETYLNSYKGSVLIVSHDRYFLDNVCKKIVELSTYKAHIFHGNYSYYVIEKERRFLLELKVYLSQQRKINRMEEQIKRYRIWGVMRDSDKMFKRAKELEKRLAKIERLDKPKYDNDKMKLRNADTSRSGKRVLEALNINKAFGDLELLRNATLEMFYKDRLAILGNNGTGKTTLLRMLLEDFPKEDNDFKWGTKLNIGYLAQEVNFENDDQTILDYFMNTHSVNQGVARRELAKGLFIRDDVLKKIRVLSGGEKSKLKLCSLTFNQTNFLILDEPTNHLDIDSREVLEEMLEEFTGTILFISHDRYFIKKIATKIGEIENRQITYYDGDYEYFRFMKKDQAIQTVKKEKKQRVKSPKKEKEVDYYKELESIESKINDINHKMNEFGNDLDKLQELHNEKEILENEYNNMFSIMEDN